MGRARLSAPCLEILYSRVVRTDNCLAAFWYGPKLVEWFSCCVDFLFGWARLCRLDLDCIFERWLDGFAWYRPATEFFTCVVYATQPTSKPLWCCLVPVCPGQVRRNPWAYLPSFNSVDPVTDAGRRFTSPFFKVFSRKATTWDGSDLYIKHCAKWYLVKPKVSL